MEPLNLKNGEVFVEVYSDELSITTVNGWSVPIDYDVAITYADNYVQNDNSLTLTTSGFYDANDSVVLVHKRARISFSRVEAIALCNFIQAAKNEIWL